MKKYVILERKKILKKFANDKNHQKVRDHCPVTGKYDVEHIVIQFMIIILS